MVKKAFIQGLILGFLLGISGLFLACNSKENGLIATRPPTTPPGSPGTISEEEKLDAMKAAVSDLFESMGAETSWVVCIAVDGKMPSSAFLDRFLEDPKFEVRSKDECVVDKEGPTQAIVRESKTPAILMEVGKLKILSPDSDMSVIQVTASYYWGPLAAGEYDYELTNEYGEWVVTDKNLRWIS